jgi:AraC-like DNA-binding protein
MKAVSETQFSSDTRRLPGDIMLFENAYRNFSCPKHFHDTYQIELVTAGTKHCYYNGMNYHVGPGSIIVINPGETHTGGTANDCMLICSAFYPTDDDWKEIFRTTCDDSKSVSAPRFSNLTFDNVETTRSLKKLFNRQLEAQDEMIVKEIYVEVLIQLASRSAGPQQQDDLDTAYYKACVARAIEFIRDNYQKNLTLNQVARVAYISPFHFLRVFRKIIGMTVHQYIICMKMEHAKSLLAKGHSIGHTFTSLGFADQTHFTKLFRKTTGLTPRQYQQAIRR